MNNAEYRFTLNLQKAQSQVTMQVNSGDTARTLLITLTNGGLTYRLGEGSTAVLSARKSNGKYLFNSCSIVEDNTVIRYDFTTATTDTPGIMQCELIITDPVENTIVSPRFTMIVDTLINGDEVFSYDENTFMVRAMAQEALREVNEATRIANEAERQRHENLMATELEANKRRIANLEAAATGNIYDTIEVSEVAHTKQFGDVLPYGILSSVDDGAKRIEIGLPYTLSGASGYRGYGDCIVKEDSVVMLQGSKYGVVIPCVLPKGAKVIVTADGRNSDTDRIYKYSFRKYPTNGTFDTSASDEYTINSSTSTLCELTDDSTHLYITKYSVNTSLTTDLEISNIKVDLQNPDDATIYDKQVVDIPSDLTYLDIPLKSGCLMRFLGDNDSEYEANYTLSYKQKIGG